MRQSFSRIALYLGAVYFSLMLFSCQQDNFSVENTNANSNANTKNGRLYFPSIQAFSEQYTAVKDLSDDELYDEMSKLYSKDFINLRPIVTDNNENKIYEQIQRRKEKVFKIIAKNSRYNNLKMTDENVLDNIDDIEDIIGDDAFASFLNGDAEVQIGEDIYKYTDVGLFITKDYSKLEPYLEVNNISENLLIATCDIDIYNYVTQEMPNGGETIIDEDMSYFRSPDADIEAVKSIGLKATCSSGGGSGGGGTSGGSTTTSSLESYIATLQPCNPSSGLFGGIFGTNKICIDKYESKKRVKTKAFDYNYLIAFHLGVKVKHQKKGWTGIWRRQDTEEVGMMIEFAQFQYDFTKVFGQALNSIDLTQKFLSPTANVPPSKTGIYEFNFSGTSFTYSIGSPYPFDVFQDDLVIEYWGNSNVIDFLTDFANKQITSKKLNKYFWDNVWSTTKSEIRSAIGNSPGEPSFEMPDNITFMIKHPTIGKIQVQKTLKEFGTNTSRREETFDWGVGVSITLKESNGYKLSKANIGPYIPQQPKKFAVKMYGLGKRNGQWHGSLLEF